MSVPVVAKRARRIRRPVDVTHKRQPTAGQLTWALEIVDALGEEFLAALATAVGEGRGRPGSVPAKAALVAGLLLTSEPGHQFEITDVTAQLVACSPEQLERLGMRPLPVHRAYQRVWDKINAVTRALTAGFTFVTAAGREVRADLPWFVKALAEASQDPTLPRSRARAVDGTEWETCGRWLRAMGVEYDGETPPDTETDSAQHRKAVELARRRARRANFEMGPDGRPIYTVDRDARAGHRSANSEHNAGLYIGYEVHPFTQVRDIAWYGKPGELQLGPDVPPYITNIILTPAGAHRSDAVVPALIAERTTIDGVECGLRDVTWDRGYSINADARTHAPLRLNGIEPVIDLATHQRTYQPVSKDVLWLDGHPFSIHTPQRLRNLARPDRNATPEDRAKLEALYNERARWRYSVHGSPDADGYLRMRCPFCSGRLASRQLTNARRAAKSAPLVALPPTVTKCCSGIVRIPPEHLRMMQALQIPFGTTAHRIAYGRRNLTETTNSLLKGQYVNLDRKYTKLMGLAKRTFALAFLVAGLNRHIGQAWTQKREAAERARLTAKTTRKRRRASTLSDIVARATVTNQKPARGPAAATAPPHGAPPGARQPREVSRSNRS